MIFILLCNCVLFLLLTTVNSVTRRISAQSMRRSSHPARRDEYRAVRNADGQPDVSAGKGWDGWWFVCVYLVLEELVGILLYSMLLCIKSLTVFSGFGEHRSWKDISHFPHEKSLSWKREANDNEKQRKGKNSCSISSRLCAGNRMTFAPYLSQPLSLLRQIVHCSLFSLFNHKVFCPKSRAN